MMVSRRRKLTSWMVMARMYGVMHQISEQAMHAKLKPQQQASGTAQRTVNTL